MRDNLLHTDFNGIKCFNLDEANAYEIYPNGGFDLTGQKRRKKRMVL
jgi:hypothetical protein